MNEKKFDIPTQVMFRPQGEDTLFLGIAYQDVIICGCCGGVFELDEMAEVYPYTVWEDITDAISGGEYPDCFPKDKIPT